jgi:hypothetical protein
MNLQKNCIEKLKNEQTLVEIYTDIYDKSDCGFINECNEDFLLLEKFDNDGNYEGFSIFMKQNISKIRWGGNELISVLTLIDNSKNVNDFRKIDLTSIQSIIRTVNDIFGHITIHIQNIDKSQCFIGQISEMDDDFIVMHEFGTYTSLDRKYVLLSIHDITLVEAEGKYEKSLKKLFGIQ